MQITPNRRLAIYLQKNQPKNHKSSIFPLQAWVEVLWGHLKSASENENIADNNNNPKNENNLIPEKNINFPELLTPYEEELIWEKVISNSDSGQSLLRVRPIASLAKDASDLIRQWNITSFSQFSDTEESEIFLEWWTEYNKIVSEQGWIGSTAMLDYVARNVSRLPNKPIVLPRAIDCIGFSEWTPQQTKFFDSLKNQGVLLSTKDLEIVPLSVTKASFPTAEEELHQAVLMIQHWLQQNPSAQIGLVVLDLEHRREEIETKLHSMLHSILPVNINVAAPIPLAKHPIISAALLGLSLTGYKIPLETISRFLRSPFFIGGIEEQDYRAALDVALHNLKQSHYSLEEIVMILKSTFEVGSAVSALNTADTTVIGDAFGTVAIAETMGTLSSVALQNLIALKSSIRGKKTTTEWIETIKLILTNLGWGLGRPLNSDETLVQAEWEPLLHIYERLGKILGNHTFQQAIYHVETLAQKKAYTPPAKNAQVHALGLLEAVGMPFDYLWCLGFSEKVWPKSPAPNPFIPLPLQCALNLPRSHAARELQVAKQFTNALCHGAKNAVIFSYPTTIEDRHLRGSPLLKHLPEQIFNPCDFEEKFFLNENENENENENCNAKAEILQTKIPPKKKLKGSIRALTLQAQCPFKAFAELRLKATPLVKPPRSLTKSERGEMVHEVLYLFWRDLKTQDNLLVLSETEIQDKLTYNINTVVSRWEKRFPKRLTPRYMLLERQRLLDLLLRFITLEKLREPFEVVALESKTQCRMGPLDFTLRIDRVDKLANGEELVIDYKTGQTQISQWLENPPAEPQLPLYCVTRSPSPIGIAFGVLRSNDLKYQGLSREEVSISGIKPFSNKSQTEKTPETWEALCHTWQQGLETLSTDFAEGVACVKPAEGDKTCRLCNLQPLCRISEGVKSLNFKDEI